MQTVGALAALVGGRVVGDATRAIRGVADLVTAGPEQISFLANVKYRAQFESTKAGAVLVPDVAADFTHTTLIVCKDPYLAMAHVAQTLHPAPTYPAGVEPGAVVHPTATIAATATVRMGAVIDARAVVGAHSVIGPQAYVGPDAKVGEHVVMHAGAKLLAQCELRARVILQAGAVVGSDGFGYAVDAHGRRHKIPQIGVVVVEEDAEIGANTTIDRAAFGVTLIGAGSKIDNLVQIAHNVVLGRDCVIVSQTGIAGSATLGDRVVVGAQGGIVGHIKVSSDVMLGARSGVSGAIDAPGIYSGAPVLPHKQWLKVTMAQHHVPELRRRVRDMDERLVALERDYEKSKESK